MGTGNLGLFRPGGEHDAIYTDGSLYMTITLSEDRLMQEAEREGLVLDAAAVRHSGVHPRTLLPETINALRRTVAAAHLRPSSEAAEVDFFRRQALAAFIDHLGRPPLITPGFSRPRGQERIVARARAWIDEHVDEPISIDAMAAAACASRRTLQRAFFNVLEELPYAYVNRLRLHWIRSDLACAAPPRGIAEASNRWGVGELGRMSGRYRALFGELPSETVRLTKLAARRALLDRYICIQYNIAKAPAAICF